MIAANVPSTMRVIVPSRVTGEGGFDTFTCSVIEELTNLVEFVVWVLPDHVLGLGQSVTQSQRLMIESFEWPPTFWQHGFDSISGTLLIALREHKSSELIQLLRKIQLQLRLEHLIKKYKITHCLFTTSMGVPPPHLRVPMVAIVHDRNWRMFPENCTWLTPARLDSNTRDWVSTADSIITPSRAVQREVTELYPECRSKIDVVPEASTVSKHQNSQPEGGVKASDPTPIFYYPGAARAHKGHLTLFKAALKLASAGHHFRVVLTGPNTKLLTGYWAAQTPQVEQCRSFYLQHIGVLQQHIEALDFCDRQQVEQLYRFSRRVVLPSQYEGFGLPLIESVARGCRVICSDIEPYREQIELYQCAGFVEVYPVDDFQALAAHMEQALLAPDDQRLSPVEAHSIAARWTWTDATRAIVSILQESTMSRP